MRNMKFSILMISFLFMMLIGFFEVKAQEFKIVTKSAEIIDNKVLVKYDFIIFNKDQSFNVWIEIKDSSGKKLNIESVSGDTGTNIPGGKNKQIVWNFMDDKIIVDDEIGIEVKAELVFENKPDVVVKPKKTVSTVKALLFSAVVPGMGISMVKQKKPYILLSAIPYGAATMSFIYNNQSQKNWLIYLERDEVKTQSEYYQLYLDQKSMSKVFLYSAGATWTSNMILTFIIAQINKYSVAGSGFTDKIKLTAGINPVFKTTELVFSYNFK